MLLLNENTYSAHLLQNSWGGEKRSKIGNRLQRKVLNSENKHTLKKQAEKAVWKVNSGLREK